MTQKAWAERKTREVLVVRLFETNQPPEVDTFKLLDPDIPVKSIPERVVRAAEAWKKAHPTLALHIDGLGKIMERSNFSTFLRKEGLVLRRDDRPLVAMDNEDVKPRKRGR